MPADWSDIRKDCPANSIALYAGVKSDYSAYDNLGFTATCTGGYNVFIDGVQYGTTYAIWHDLCKWRTMRYNLVNKRYNNRR